MISGLISPDYGGGMMIMITSIIVSITSFMIGAIGASR